MNELQLSFLLIPVLLLHLFLRRSRSRRSYSETQAVLWSIDGIYALCGALLFLFGRTYPEEFIFTVFDTYFILFYIMLFLLFLFAAPAGLRLFSANRDKDRSPVPEAEYTFDKVASMLKNFIFLLLLFLPLFLLPLNKLKELSSQVLVLCFLFLPPLCVRQILFWFRVIRISKV